MKNIIITILALVISWSSAKAQEDRRDKIASAKIGFITKRLDLSSKEAQAFWPVYNEYEKAMRDIRDDIHSLFRRLETSGDEDAEALFTRYLDLKEKEMETEKVYSRKFLAIISHDQLLRLFKAEKDFTVLLLKRLEGPRPGNRGRR